MVKKIIIYWNVVKLVLIFLGFFIFLFAPVFVFNFCVSHFHWYIPALIGALPLLFLLICIVSAWIRSYFGNIGGIITNIRYDTRFPFLFHYERSPKHPRFTDITGLRSILQPNDILLRRQERYLDGLILEQTSYFTHAAIYCENGMVMEAVGTGVRPTALNEFAICDDIAVVRFNENLVEDSNWIKEHHYPDETFLENIRLNLKLKAFFPENFDKKETSIAQAEHVNSLKNGDVIADDPAKKKADEEQIYISSLKNTAFDGKAARIKMIKLINDDIRCKKIPGLSQIGITEKSLFDYLLEKLKEDPPITVDKTKLQTFMPNIQKLTEMYKGRPYDFGFNFTEMGSLSCVEFVWDCYKALFPLHQIRRRFTYYFRFVRTLVIVPDKFLESPFFALQYSSLPIKDPTDIKGLNHFIAKKKLNFYLYAFKIMLWQIAIMLVLYILSRFKS